MNKQLSVIVSIGLATFAASALAQPPGITMEQIGRQLPLEGAPLAIPGPYEVVSEPAFGLPSHVIYRPANLSAFPNQDTLPVMAWGNGGCAIDSTRYGDFLSTIASHGFLVISTVAVEGESGRGVPENMIAAFDWADAENARAGSPLNGKIATGQMSAMGQSCGGFMSVSAGADSRVGTIGMFNSAVQPPNGNSPGGSSATTDDLAKLHGPVLMINGGEVDFMYEPAQDNFKRINHVPVFYGARENAGHTATVFHPGGGEYANVASNWLRYVFKDDAEAGKMFVGNDCSLCMLDTWETDSKGLD
jgi:dienelactone hydrolase